MGLMGDADTNTIINLIEAILEREQYGQLNPDTIELLKADLNYLKECVKKSKG